jgi:predicted DNA-binding transcriptional regulator AlpA
MQSLLKTKEAAAVLNLSTSTLAKMRRFGGGPKTVAAGKRAVRYRYEDLEAWVRERVSAAIGGDMKAFGYVAKNMPQKV